MAHSTVRFAAGASVIAASLLIAGPNPAQAVADKRGSDVFSNDDYRKNPRSGQGGLQRIASNIANDVLNLPGSGGQKSNSAPPEMNLGSEPQLLMVESADAPTAMRSAAVAEAPVGDNVVAAVPRGGGGYAGQPVVAFGSPRVVIGNGRTPGTHVAHVPHSGAVLLHDSLIAAPEAMPSVPAPTAIEINLPPLPPPLPPIERIGPAELVVGEFGTGTADTVTDPLAGVAGLILIPAIGAVLGYRQARAAQSLRESLRLKV